MPIPFKGIASGAMELSDLLASPSVRAKEAEALAILIAQAGPAKQMLHEAKREFGHVLGLRDLGELISRAAEAGYKQGKKEATRFLFDAYAATVFDQVSDAETFIAFLGDIGDRVLATLEWEKRAWNRAIEGGTAGDQTASQLGVQKGSGFGTGAGKPTAFRTAWRWFRALWSQNASSNTERSIAAGDSSNFDKASDTMPPQKETIPLTNGGTTNVFCLSLAERTGPFSVTFWSCEMIFTLCA
jgi:hypothetical protein